MIPIQQVQSKAIERASETNNAVKFLGNRVKHKLSIYQYYYYST